MTTPLSNLQREWSEHHKLACWIIHKRLRKLGRYDDELIGEALAQAWMQFQRCRQRVADVPHAIALAARAGVGRALRGSRFCPKPERGYLDALDVRGRAALDRLAARGERILHRSDRRFCDPAEIPARPENNPECPQERISALLAKLPSEVRGVALMLSLGHTRTEIARMFDRSPSMVSRQCAMIEIFLRAIQRERNAQRE